MTAACWELSVICLNLYYSVGSVHVLSAGPGISLIRIRMDATQGSCDGFICIFVSAICNIEYAYDASHFVFTPSNSQITGVTGYVI
jgi:hypothetical protein